LAIVVNEEHATIPLPTRASAVALSGAEPATVRQQASSDALSLITVGSADARSEPDALSTTGGRKRLRAGLVFWARLNALIVLGLTIVMRMTDWLDVGTVEVPWPSFLLAALLLGTSGALDQLRLDRRRLEIADLFATVASGVGICLMVWTLPGMRLDEQELVFQVAMAQLLMTRAALVPSSGQRSLWIGGLALLPGVGYCVVARIAAEQPWLVPCIRLTVPGLAILVASMLASRRIYGLQRQVNEARRLGPYTLVEKVGAGGMGEVFRARHALLRRPTAIKLIRPESATESSLLQFEREAQLTSQLTHPSTIQIHDFGRNESGVIYYAMEYIEGLTLHELVELTGPQPAPRVIAILRQVCGSLAEAHAVGLVHRDIKPSNIMLCERGRVADVVKVLDFGLVKLRGQPGNTLDSKSDLIVGTPGFMSPEAIMEPSKVDGRTDLYALGAVGYYLLTGHPLFAGQNDVAVLLDQVSTPPVPMSLRLGTAVPGDLERVILDCLSKEPGRRPQSADALSHALRACRDAHGWSQAQAQRWWAAHRELVHQRIRERSGGTTVG
jgi:hypothetical protein